MDDTGMTIPAKCEAITGDRYQGYKQPWGKGGHWGGVEVVRSAKAALNE